MRKRLLRHFIMIFVLVLLAIAFFMLDRYNLLPSRSYSLEDFGIGELSSPVDYDQDGTDDYHDLLLGAKKDAANKPDYVSKYYKGGYPPENEGVCTDTVWRAFREAGYDLRIMVDNDIQAHPEDYPDSDVRDKNIDFRRVSNLMIFLDHHAQTLTTDISKTAQWQPGDIVVFNAGQHIGIVSDRRNKKGQPYIIHNAGQPVRDENYLKRGIVYRHYRWDASRLSAEVAVPFVSQ
ncbi:MAG: DUF1287 domain-containing protein [Erysipelotrichaceae bacterium]|nr:DUF1287 domain-containing protein [Erysipelotrichaceae bacterium]